MTGKHLQQYIKSGRLEEYVFNFLKPDLQEEVTSLKKAHPAIKTELNEIELALEKFALANAMQPANDLRDILLKKLGFDKPNPFNLNDLPFTGTGSDHQNWLATVRHLIPPQPFDNFFLKVIREDKQATQMLVVTKNDVSEESHENIAESFFILEGKCICTVGYSQIELSPGGYLDIPLHAKHDVRLVTPYVIAILQHRSV